MSVFPGMAGNQALDWSQLDSEIKTAGLKDVSGVVYFTDGLVDCSHIGPSCPSGLVSPVLVIEGARLIAIIDLLAETCATIGGQVSRSIEALPRILRASLLRSLQLPR
jgi:hypothetical protein